MKFVFYSNFILWNYRKIFAKFREINEIKIEAKRIQAEPAPKEAPKRTIGFGNIKVKVKEKDDFLTNGLSRNSFFEQEVKKKPEQKPDDIIDVIKCWNK